MSTSGSRNTGLGGVFKSLAKSLKPTSGNVPVVINAKVVGGGADLPQLLQQLQHGTLPSRASAAARITESLEKYSISSVPEVWYLARDMCDGRYQSSIRRVALKLMIQSMHQDDDFVSIKLMFYRDIVAYCHVGEHKLDPDFDLFLKAVRTLTRDGREIHDLCIYGDNNNLIGFLLRCFKVLVKQAKKYSRDKTYDDVTFQNLIKLTHYLANCVKYSYPLWEEPAVSAALALVASVSTQTSNQDILTKLVELAKTIVVHGIAPPNTLPQTIQTFCLLSSVSDEVDALCWSAVSTLCLESPYNVVSIICDTVMDPQLVEHQGEISDIEPNIHGNHTPLLAALGAISMLERLMVFMSTDMPQETTDSSYELIRASVRDCIGLDIPVLNSGLLRMLDRLLSANDHKDKLRSETIFSILFPFQVWYASTDSIFAILLKFKLNTPQDLSYWSAICSSIFDKYKKHELMTPKDRLIDLFTEYPQVVSDEIVQFVLAYYREGNLCSSLNPLWTENSRKLLRSFFFPIEEKLLLLQLRVEALSVIKEGFENSFAFDDTYNINLDIVYDILRASFGEQDPMVSEYIYDTFLFNFIQLSSLPVFRGLLNVFSPFLQMQTKPRQEHLRSIVSFNSFGSNSQNLFFGSNISSQSGDLDLKSANRQTLVGLAKTLSNCFIVLSTTDALKAAEIYEFIIQMLILTLRNDREDVSVVLLRPLIRIRCTEDGQIFFTNPSEMEGLSTTLKRNISSENYDKNENALWLYPEEFDYLPSSSFDCPNSLLEVFSAKSNKLQVNIQGSATIDISKWVNIVISIFEEYFHWEIYSFTWAHFCSQFANMRLFEGLDSQVVKIQKILCDQLTLTFPKALSFPIKGSTVNRGDLQVAFIRSMSSLIGYHDIFSKQEDDHIISSLLFGLGSWEKTAIPAIHMLTICCHEIPSSLKKYLIPILTRLQVGVTSAFASPSILEFLMALIHVPRLTSNFTTDQFKRAFAISFKYIQHASDMKIREQQKGTQDDKSRVQSHGVEAEVDTNISTQSKTFTPILSEYLFLVSHMVIARWYLKVRLEERPHISAFIVRNLLHSSRAKDASQLDDLTVAFLDLIIRFTYSDIPLKAVTTQKVNSASQRTAQGKWLIGQSIVNIESDIFDGSSTITVRRPTGVSVFDVKLDPSMLSPFSDTNKKPIVLSSYLFLQMVRPLDMYSHSKPLALLDDAATERAINTLDRISVVSHHKAGIMYIGPNQKTEVEILGNTSGSSEYHRFLDGLGQLVRLKDANSLYTGGLDTENGTDGEYAYVYFDEIVQLAYHTTTLMPNMLNDKYMAMKKRHIGNNYVNVFFDESGLPFNFNVIKSQFNFLNIVITPLSRGAKSSDTKYYKIKSYRRSGVPGIFSTSHFKIISLEQLPLLVRNLVLISDRLAAIWHHAVDGTYSTNWALRVKHLNTLREKTIESHRQLREEQAKLEENGPAKHLYLLTPETASPSMTQSFLKQLLAIPAPAVSNSVVARYEYTTDNDSELYAQLEFNSFV